MTRQTLPITVQITDFLKSVVQMPYDYQTIRLSDGFGPFKYQTSPSFRSPLFVAPVGIVINQKEYHPPLPFASFESFD
jgi:hypothetical protein